MEDTNLNDFLLMTEFVRQLFNKNSGQDESHIPYPAGQNKPSLNCPKGLLELQQRIAEGYCGPRYDQRNTVVYNLKTERDPRKRK